MACRIFEAGNLVVIALNRGEMIFSRYIVPENVDDYVEIRKTNNYSKLLVMKEDCVLVVEDLTENGMTCQHVRFIRENRRAKGLGFARPRQFPRLRAALKHNERMNDHAPGGFQRYAVVYSDEIAVADYAEQGSHGFIVERGEISALLEALPSLRKDQAA